MWPRFSVFQLSQSCRLRLARAMKYFTPVVMWSFPASAIDARHLTSNSFLTAWLQRSSCRLRARIYEVRCYLIVVEERRRFSVRLEIDDRVFSRCRWQRTQSLGYLTNWCTWLVVGQLSEVHFPYSDVHVFLSAGHRAVPDGVDVVGTRHHRPCLRQLFTGKFQPSSTWLRRFTVVRGHDNGSPARSSRGRRSDVLPSSSSDVALVDTIANTISASQWSGRWSLSPLLDATCSSPSSRNVRNLACWSALYRFALLSACCRSAPFPFSLFP